MSVDDDGGVQNFLLPVRHRGTTQCATTMAIKNKGEHKAMIPARPTTNCECTSTSNPGPFALELNI